MIPKQDPAKIANKGERRMYQALQEQLPDDWTVIYNYVFTVEIERVLHDGQADFIVVAPNKGLVFLEVKGSHGMESVNGVWYRLDRFGNQERADNPFAQVDSTKHSVVNSLARTLRVTKEQFPGIYWQAVVFPFGRIVGSLPPAYSPLIVIDYSDMSRLHERLVRLFEDSEHAHVGVKFTPMVMQRVVDALRGDTRFMPVLSADVDEDERRIQELTKQQYRAFQCVIQNPRVRVEGTAGSGKTMLAVWAANHFVQEGKRVLFLCYNRTLAAWLRLQDASEGKVDIYSFFALARQRVEQAAQNFARPLNMTEKDFWETHVPGLFLDALDALEMKGKIEKYDIVIVDEAQDFHQDWWGPVPFLLKDPDKGAFYIFYDPNQAGVYDRGIAYPSSEGTMVFTLPENCRNTKRITEYCGNVIDTTIPSFPLSPEGTPTEITPAMSTLDQQVSKVKEVVRRWVSDGMKPSRIAILSPFSNDNSKSCLSRLTEIGNTPIQYGEEALEPWIGNRVLLGCTIKSFKGLEADCVIISDIPEVGSSGFNKSDLYVAASRAKHRLVLIPSNENVANELRHWITP